MVYVSTVCKVPVTKNCAGCLFGRKIIIKTAVQARTRGPSIRAIHDQSYLTIFSGLSSAGSKVLKQSSLGIVRLSGLGECGL